MMEAMIFKIPPEDVPYRLCDGAEWGAMAIRGNSSARSASPAHAGIRKTLATALSVAARLGKGRSADLLGPHGGFSLS